MIREVIHCRGHPNVRATHRSTLEFTKEDYLTPKGDCILCVEADKAISDLSPELKKALREGRQVLIRIRVGNLVDEVSAFGSPDLTLESNVSMVVRKSEYVDGRTLAIKANKAARDIDRRIVEILRNPENWVEIEILVL